MALSSGERSHLAIQLFRSTILTLQNSKLDLDTVVVTGSEKIREICLEYSVQTLPEAINSDLNQILGEACRCAYEYNYKQIILIPSDLANPNFQILKQFTDSPINENHLTIFPSYDGGTNCLISTLPILFPFQYGKGSAMMHIEMGRKHGYITELVDIESFRLDIDTIEDLKSVESKFS